jgi:flagella basal body P-ring formation protein FlgA
MRKQLMTGILMLSFMVAGGALTSSEGTEVRIRPTAEVKGNAVRLSEVARILGAPRTDRNRLERLLLASAPPNGQTFRLSRKFVVSRIQMAGFGDVEVTGATQVLVHRPKRVLKRERIESAVRRYLASRLESRQGDVEVNTIAIPKQKILLPGGKKIRLVVKATPQTRFLGRTPLILSIMQGSSEIRRVWVAADISVFTRVPVAVVPIRSQERLSAAQFEMRRHNLAALPDNVVTSPEALEGAHAIRPLSPGETIRKSDVRFPYLVKQGNLVRLYARRGKLVITALGKALDAGRKGELVRVINIDSNKPVQGRVIEKSSVEVLF